MNKYDVAVVGSGPGGAASAYILSASGMKVALIDRCVFPRNKLCGGLLSGRAKTAFESVFGESWRPAIECETRGARFFGRDGLLNSIGSSYPLYLTSRKAFDSYLLELASKKGSKIFHGVPVASIDKNRVNFKGGTSFTSDFIIGADGATSRVRNCLFPDSFHKEDYALCFQTELPRSELRETKLLPEIYFGFVRWGYAWIFPKGESLSIGIGGSLSKNGNMKNLFTHFFRHVTGRDPESIKGCYTPLGNYSKRPGIGNALLVGDAAGLVDPITGEGIAFALMSGKFAAESILKAANDGTPHKAYDLYKPAYRSITRFFSPAKVLRNFLYPSYPQARLVRALPRATEIAEGYLGLIAGRMNYYSFARIAFKETVKDLFTRTGRQ